MMSNRQASNYSMTQMYKPPIGPAVKSQKPLEKEKRYK
jgi:hypothetical protein